MASFESIILTISISNNARLHITAGLLIILFVQYTLIWSKRFGFTSTLTNSQNDIQKLVKQTQQIQTDNDVYHKSVLSAIDTIVDKLKK